MVEASSDSDVQTISSAKRPKTNRPMYKLIPSRGSLKKAGAGHLSTCNAIDQRNRLRVVLRIVMGRIKWLPSAKLSSLPSLPPPLDLTPPVWIQHAPVYIQNVSTCTGNMSKCV